jgi:uncharacterized membrane-anchored protein YjiN (DUF445 family)
MSAPGRPADAEKVRALRRMKLFAASLLAFAAAAFLVSVLIGDGNGVWGYLETGSEAAMVGGLADWFAVTALFRHPLGLPIPHTAIIPRKKDQIGASLGSFVQQNFLTGEIVAERLAALDVPRRVGDWLADPVRARRLSRDAGAGLVGVVAMMRDDELGVAVEQFAQARLREVPAAPILARVVEAAIDGGQHQVALTSVVRGLATFMEENRAMFRERLSDESPSWVPGWVDERIFSRLYSGVLEFLADVAARDDHELRAQFDVRLREYVIALRTDPDTIARAEQLKEQLLEHPAVRAWTGSLWETIKASILTAADDPASQLHTALASVIVQGGRALAGDVPLQRRVDRLLASTATRLLARYGDDVSELISATVERWDAAETGRRLELQIGRDLQFIRVNGTVVGALVGIAIHTVALVIR